MSYTVENRATVKAKLGDIFDLTMAQLQVDIGALPGGQDYINGYIAIKDSVIDSHFTEINHMYDSILIRFGVE